MKVRAVQIITGLVCTFFFLALALYRVQLGSIGAALAHANPTWIGAAIIAYAINLSLRTRRWQIILRLSRQFRIGSWAELCSSGMD
jgi:uncharacterized membrane protein YbhN (UPF0104 family)